MFDFVLIFLYLQVPEVTQLSHYVSMDQDYSICFL